MGQDKNLKVGGNAKVEADGAKLNVTPDGSGLIAVTVTDVSGSVLYIHHPLSGWYIQVDTREEHGE